MTGHYSVGVAGCGKIANDRHLPALKALPHVSVEAVYDHNWENAEHSADAYDVPAVYDDVDEFVSADLDFTTVCTPPFAHADVAIPALEADLAVLTEKPMAVELEDADAMVDAATETGNALGVVHNFLYASSVQQTKELVRSGKLGEVQYVKGFQLSSSGRELPSWYTDLPGGLFFDESPHLLYLMEEFAGGLAVEDVTLQETSEPRQLDSVTATYSSDADVVGQLTMAFTAPVSEWFLVVVGSRRVAVVDVFRDVGVHVASDGSHSPLDVVKTAVSGMAQFTWGMGTSALATLRGELFFGYDTLASQFTRAIGTDVEPPVTGEDGRDVLQYIYDTLEKGGVD